MRLMEVMRYLGLLLAMVAGVGCEPSRPLDGHVASSNTTGAGCSCGDLPGTTSAPLLEVDEDGIPYRHMNIEAWCATRDALEAYVNARGGEVDGICCRSFVHFEAIGDEATDEILHWIGDRPFFDGLTFCSKNITDKGLDAIAGAPHLTNLSLTNASITDEGLKRFLERTPTIELLVLTDCDHLAGEFLPSLCHLEDLRVLGLSGEWVTNATLEPLGGCGPIQSLSLSDCPNLNAAGYESLNRMEIDSVSVSTTGGDDQHVADLVRIESLRSVSLRGCEVTSKGMRMLAGKQLGSLSLQRCPNVRDEDLAMILPSEELHHLLLGRMPAIRGECFDRLLECPSLNSLYFINVPLTEEAMLAVARTDADFISLYDAAPTDAVLRELARRSWGRHGSRLSLRLCRLDDDAVETFAEAYAAARTSPGKGDLYELELEWNPRLTSASLESLRRIEGLRQLNLRNTQVTREAADAFEEDTRCTVRVKTLTEEQKRALRENGRF